MTRRPLENRPDPVFSLCAARDEDLRAAAAEFEAWLDAVNAAVPDPTPDNPSHPSDALPTSL